MKIKELSSMPNHRLSRKNVYLEKIRSVFQELMMLHITLTISIYMIVGYD